MHLIYLPIPKKKSSYSLGLLVEGKFQSSFLSNDEFVKSNENHLSISKANMKTILLADADNLYNIFNYKNLNSSSEKQKVSNNIDFLTNSIDFLCGNDYRIKLRNTKKKNLQFDKLKLKKQQIKIARNKGIAIIQKDMQPIINKINQLLIKRQSQQIFTQKDERNLEALSEEKKVFDKQIKEKTLLADKEFNKLKSRIFIYNISLIPLLFSLFFLFLYIYRKVKQKND